MEQNSKAIFRDIWPGDTNGHKPVKKQGGFVRIVT